MSAKEGTILSQSARTLPLNLSSPVYCIGITKSVAAAKEVEGDQINYLRHEKSNKSVVREGEQLTRCCSATTKMLFTVTKK